MPLQIVRNDITKMKVDAIVNAANKKLLGGGGVDGCIHRAAGPQLLEECRTLHGCETGEAKITKGYRLPCRYVIHTVGPVYRDGRHNERALLASCYRNSLILAGEHGCETVAFPLISSGVYGYPKDEALEVAEKTIEEFLELSESDMTVYIVIFDKNAYDISSRKFDDIKSYIDDNYVAEVHDSPYFARNRSRLADEEFDEFHTKYSISEDSSAFTGSASESRKKTSKHAGPKAEPVKQEMLTEDVNAASFSAMEPGVAYEAKEAPRSRVEPIRPHRSMVPDYAPGDGFPGFNGTNFVLDESFQEMLLRKIKEKGMTDPECYKGANIDRKLFSKIHADKYYKPKKQTVLAFAISLRLSLPETKEMLEKAGYALSHAFLLDVIVEYYIVNGKYNIYEINETLFSYDQVLLGSI